MTLTVERTKKGDTDGSARGIKLWEETGVPGENPRSRLGDPILFHVRGSLGERPMRYHCDTR